MNDNSVKEFLKEIPKLYLFKNNRIIKIFDTVLDVRPYMINVFNFNEGEVSILLITKNFKDFTLK